MTRSASKTAWKSARRAEGGCIDCAAGKATKAVRCDACAEKHRAKNRGRSRRARGTCPSPVSFARTKPRPGQQFPGTVKPPSEIPDSGGRAPKPHLLRRDPPKRVPPGPVEKRSAPIEQARPAAVKRDVERRAEGNVRTW